MRMVKIGMGIETLEQEGIGIYITTIMGMIARI